MLWLDGGKERKCNNFLFHYERKKHWSGISDGWTDAHVVPFKKKKNCWFTACSWKTPATNYVLATHVLQMIYESGSDFSYHMNRSDQARLQKATSRAGQPSRASDQIQRRRGSGASSEYCRLHSPQTATSSPSQNVTSLCSQSRFHSSNRLSLGQIYAM